MSYTPTFILLFSVLHLCGGQKAVCNDFDAKTFNFHDVLGSWYVVGVVSNVEEFHEKNNPCVRTEISKVDEEGLRWLIQNQTLLKDTVDLSQSMKGTAIRQSLHFNYRLDIWSRTLEGAKGCFEEVLAMYSEDDQSFTPIIRTYWKETMQLHLLNAKDGLEPYLLQFLSGHVMLCVIHRRTPGPVARQELEPSLEMLNKMSSNYTLAYLCKYTPNKRYN